MVHLETAGWDWVIGPSASVTPLTLRLTAHLQRNKADHTVHFEPVYPNGSQVADICKVFSPPSIDMLVLAHLVLMWLWMFIVHHRGCVPQTDLVWLTDQGKRDSQRDNLHCKTLVYSTAIAGLSSTRLCLNQSLYVSGIRYPSKTDQITVRTLNYEL